MFDSQLLGYLGAALYLVIATLIVRGWWKRIHSSRHAEIDALVRKCRAQKKRRLV
jgi:hypothetical protein